MHLGTKICCKFPLITSQLVSAKPDSWNRTCKCILSLKRLDAIVSKMHFPIETGLNGWGEIKEQQQVISRTRLFAEWTMPKVFCPYFFLLGIFNFLIIKLQRGATALVLTTLSITVKRRHCSKIKLLLSLFAINLSGVMLNVAAPKIRPILILNLSLSFEVWYERTGQKFCEILKGYQRDSSMVISW